MDTKKVKAPSGFHWMKSGNAFKLMKHTGKFVKHKGGSTKSSPKSKRGKY